MGFQECGLVYLWATDSFVYFGGSFICSGCGIWLANTLANYFKVSINEESKIRIINCLLDRIKLEAEIRLEDSKNIELKDSIRKIETKLDSINKDINKAKQLSIEEVSFEYRGNVLAKLYQKKDTLMTQLEEYSSLCEEKNIEIEEMRERYDTLSEISTMESGGVYLDTFLEEKYMERMNDLKVELKCKDDYIKRLENKKIS